MIKKILLFAIFLAPIFAQAGTVNCNEKITTIHIHSNGNIYFNTDGVCQRWCQLNWTSETQVSRAYSAMLESKLSGKNLIFVWPDSEVTDCNTPTTVSYVSPNWINVDF